MENDAAGHIAPRICAYCKKPSTRKFTVTYPLQCKNCYQKEYVLRLKTINPEEYKRRNKKHYIKCKPFYRSDSRRRSNTMHIIKRRDPNTDLTGAWLDTNIFGHNCYYCGVSEESAQKLTGNRMHVDKKHPEMGYKQANCVPACKACNTAKLHYWTAEEAGLLGQVIKTFYAKRGLK